MDLAYTAFKFDLHSKCNDCNAIIHFCRFGSFLRVDVKLFYVIFFCQIVIRTWVSILRLGASNVKAPKQDDRKSIHAMCHTAINGKTE